MTNSNSVTTIRARLQCGGDTLAAERQELEAAIQAILTSGGRLTNKVLIIYVIRELEQERDLQGRRCCVTYWNLSSGIRLTMQADGPPDILCAADDRLNVL